MAPYGNFWQDMATFYNLWLLLAVYGNIWQGMATFGNLGQLLARYGYFWYIMATFGNITGKHVSWRVSVRNIYF